MRNIGITGLTLIGITLLVAIGVGSILAGTIALQRIDGTLNNITDVAAPTVETVGDVAVHLGDAQRYALEVLADDDGAESQQLMARYEDSAAAYAASIEELDTIVSDPALQLLVEETVGEWAAFDALVHDMFTAHATALTEEEAADQLMATFEAEGAALIGRLAEISAQQQEEMQATEDQADVFANRPSTTAATLNDLIGDLFEVDYPAYAAAMSLQIIVSTLEGAAREYMGSEDMTVLPDIRDEFVDAFSAAQAHFDVLQSLTESDAEQQAFGALLTDFNTWVANADEEEQLFDTQRDMLTAAQAADDLSEEMEAAAQVLMATLEEVADAADAVSDGADDVAAQQVQSSQIVMGGLLIGMLAIGALIAWASARLIGRPIRDVTQAMTNISSGKLETKLAHTNRTNEIGQMTNALVVFLEGEIARRAQEEREKQRNAETAHVVQSLSGALNDLSAGDLTVRIADDFDGGFDVLKQNFNASLDRLQAIMKDVIATSQTIAGGSDALSQAASHLATRTEQQAAALAESAATVGQIKDSVEVTAATAKETNTMVHASRILAEQGEDVIRDTVTAMQDIEKGSQQISQIIGTIDDIAFQTNLLALNAGVEAARAGDAGRGFAVVASEVRELAQRAGDAAREIKDLIETSQRQVAQGAKLTTDANAALQKISEQVVQVSEKVSEIDINAQTQAQSISEISRAMNELDDLTQQNAAMVEETTAAAIELKSDVSDLQHGASIFKTRSRQGQPVQDAPRLAQAS